MVITRLMAGVARSYRSIAVSLPCNFCATSSSKKYNWTTFRNIYGQSATAFPKTRWISKIIFLSPCPWIAKSIQRYTHTRINLFRHNIPDASIVAPTPTSTLPTRNVFPSCAYLIFCLILIFLCNGKAYTTKIYHAIIRPSPYSNTIYGLFVSPNPIYPIPTI